MASLSFGQNSLLYDRGERGEISRPMASELFRCRLRVPVIVWNQLGIVCTHWRPDPQPCGDMTFPGVVRARRVT